MIRRLTRDSADERGSRRMGRNASRLIAAALLLAVFVVASGSGAARVGVPFLQQGPKLVAGGATGDPQFGVSVSLSADGNTALVGGRSDDGGKGAAWIFTRSGSMWEQLGGKLTGSGAVGAARFGSSVALSADGKTALIGGTGDNGLKGAAWVFTRSGSAWNQQGAKLIGGGETGNGSFGGSAALSADGNTALVGGNLDDSVKGAAWVFARAAGVWSQQGAKLVGAGATGAARQGMSVALSADGNTALVGGDQDNGDKGAVWVFARSGVTWNPQGAKLTAADEVGAGMFGAGVSLSAGGNNAIVGGPQDDGGKGAAWVFNRSGTTWSQQGGKLTGSGAVGVAWFGRGVALAPDTSIALIGGTNDNGAKGAAWVFDRSGSAWSQRGAKLTGGGETGNGWFGGSAALSADGNTALVGGNLDDNVKGAAWVFSSAPPAVSALSPVSGPATGGTLVKITGTNLAAVTEVKFGTVPATLTKVVSDGELSAVSPGGSGTVDVTVTGPTGTSATGDATKFTYAAPVVGTPKPSALNARIVYATVIVRGKRRTLNVRIRVSNKATAKLRILSGGVQLLKKSFAVKGGANTLKVPLPKGLSKGTKQIKIALTSAGSRAKTYTVGVHIPG